MTGADPNASTLALLTLSERVALLVKKVLIFALAIDARLVCFTVESVFIVDKDCFRTGAPFSCTIESSMTGIAGTGGTG